MDIIKKIEQLIFFMANYCFKEIHFASLHDINAKSLCEGVTG